MAGAFKAYDIRGVYGRDFDAGTVYRVGRRLPELLGADTVLVGRDVRKSSGEIFEALAEGLTDSGASVDDMGLCTTPMTYYFTGAKGYRCAVMITASHNPAEYNGLKISRSGALPVGEDSGLKELETAASRPAPAKSPIRGKVRTVDFSGEYIGFLKSRLPDLSGLHAAVDCSNGMAGLLAREVFGGAAEYMFDMPDGAFPNHSPNPMEASSTAALSETVCCGGLDLGVIFDGDADRVMYVDEEGRFIRPDLIIGLLAGRALSAESGAKVLCDIRTSRGVTEAVERMGGTPVIWKVGHAFAKVKLRETGAAVGGEVAGHYYFRDFFCCDSAMLCACEVLGCASAAVRSGGKFSDLISEFDVYANSGEINFTVEDKDSAMKCVVGRALDKFGSPERTLDFDGVRCDWRDWWFNVRKSNTEPFLRLIVEAADSGMLESRLGLIKEWLSPFICGGGGDVR